MRYKKPAVIFRLSVLIVLTGLMLTTNTALAGVSVKVDRVTINAPVSVALPWLSVTFQQSYSTVPVVVVLPTSDNNDPATLRIRNVTTSGFEIALIEAASEDGGTDEMQVDYMAFEVGSYSLSGGMKMVVGSHTTATFQGKRFAGTGWDTVGYSGISGVPAIISQIQTVNSQSALNVGEVADPWLEVTTRNVGSSTMQIALERNESVTGTVVAEQIGYIVIEHGTGRVNFGGGNQVDFEGIRSSDSILGWDNGCYSINFNGSYSATPIAVASQNTRDGGDGGWLRRCALDSSRIGLRSDEDRFDAERAHTTERAGIILAANVFSGQSGGKKLEAAQITIPSSKQPVTFTTVTFPNAFDEIPMVFVLPTDDGNPPVNIRLRNVSVNGFELAAVQPDGSSGGHPQMVVDYIAVIPGQHALANGDIWEVGKLAVGSFQSGVSNGPTGWTNLNFATSFASTPAVLLQIQSINNELAMNPAGASIPWLTPDASSANSSQILLALGRAEATAGGSNASLSSEEIAYFVVANASNNQITATDSSQVDYEMFLTPNNIRGFGDGCFNNNFSQSYATPYAIASQMTRNGSNGGWVRRCNLATTQIGLTVDEDQAQDSERNHTNEIASVFVFSKTFEASFSEVDHFRIAAASTAVNCQPHSIAISAHAANGDVVTTFDGTIDLTTSTSNGDWLSNGSEQGNLAPSGSDQGIASYQFNGADNGVVTLLLRDLNVETININIDSGGITESVSDDPSITYQAAGLRFYDNLVSNPLNAVQTAGKSANTNPNATFPGIEAINTNTVTGACEALLMGDNNVDFLYTCIDPLPAKCAKLALTITGAADTIAVSHGVYNGLDLNFGDATQSQAAFDFNYPDAGQIQLTARVTVPASGGLVLTGSSNTITVKPAGLCVESTDANASCATANLMNCSVLAKAGDSFNLKVSARAWQSAGETDSDFCSGNAVTPSYTANSIALGSVLVEPVGGNNGGVTPNAVNITTAGEVSALIRQAEVGVFTFSATPPNYFSQSISASSSEQIGRFAPDRFIVTSTTPALAERCMTFTYMDQPFYYSTAPQLSVTAYNSVGTQISNYDGSAWKLANTLTRTINENTASASLSMTVDIDATLSGFNDFDGTVLMSLDVGADGDSMTYNRTTTPISSFNADYDLVFSAAGLNDGDACHDPDDNGVCDVLTVGNITGNELRYGRLNVSDAFGPESAELDVSVVAQYWDNGLFVLNTSDSCSNLSRTSSVKFDSSFIASDPIQVTVGASITSASFSNLTASDVELVSGTAGLAFSAPGAGNMGSFSVDVNLAALPWLRFDWNLQNGFSDNDDMPTATVSFGSYRGHDRVIYWREDLQ